MILFVTVLTSCFLIFRITRYYIKNLPDFGCSPWTICIRFLFLLTGLVASVATAGVVAGAVA
jgi:hypothetical protein